MNNWNYESETSSFSQSDDRRPWEDEVNSHGELFYVSHYAADTEVVSQDEGNVLINHKKDNKSISEYTGVLSKLLKRRSGRRRSLRRKHQSSSPSSHDLSSDQSSQATSHRKIGGRELEPLNVYMKIDFHHIKITGRRDSIVETLLGLKVVSNGSQIIIIDIIQNSPAHLVSSSFCKGDILHNINGVLMTPENIENYLRNISITKEVKEVVLCVLRKKSDRKIDLSKSASFPEKDLGMEGFSVIYIRTSQSSDELTTEDLTYKYPRDGNLILEAKGAFLTLNHLLPFLLAGQPISSTLSVKDKTLHVMYVKKDNGLLLVTMPDSVISLGELHWVVTDVVRCLTFTFQSLSRCFSGKDINILDSFFQGLFKRTLQNHIGSSASEFELLLPEASTLSLPHELFIRVDDALTELEANDVDGYPQIRSPIIERPNLLQENQKLFSIVGSCYFYKGFNSCSHLNKDDLLDIMSLCRQSDILNYMRKGVSEMIFWKEVFPASVGRGLNSHIHVPYSLLSATWYLLIVAKDHSFLCVLMESGGSTMRPLQNPGPNVAYVEEAVETLNHIIKIGVPTLANKLFKEPEKEPSIQSSSNDLSSSTEASTSLLSSSVGETTLNFQPNSYDSCSSEDCNMPILGRRAERELAQETFSRVSDFSDDSDLNKDSKYNSKTDIFDLEMKFPRKITSGKRDVLLHFVHLDKASGFLITPYKNIAHGEILNNFKVSAHEIHRVLMNTISFRKLKTQEVSLSTMNKSMIAIKEHGILFQCGNEEKHSLQTYWVVGRIYFTPQLREVYLCYDDSSPQNMVEVAFRLALQSPG